MGKTAAAYCIQNWPPGEAAFDDWVVRRTLVLLRLVGLTTLLTLDPLVCPDGCTTDHNSASTSDQLPVSSGDCVLHRTWTILRATASQRSVLNHVVELAVL